jgi:hypothetical protein
VDCARYRRGADRECCIVTINTPESKPFEVAIDVSKQLLTLSTAIITLTITFSKDILGGTSNNEKHLLAFAWLSFFISILGGIWFLYAANGSISEMANESKSIYDSNTAIPMGVQQVAS